MISAKTGLSVQEMLPEQIALSQHFRVAGSVSDRRVRLTWQFEKGRVVFYAITYRHRFLLSPGHVDLASDENRPLLKGDILNEFALEILRNSKVIFRAKQDSYIIEEVDPGFHFYIFRLVDDRAGTTGIYGATEATLGLTILNEQPPPPPSEPGPLGPKELLDALAHWKRIKAEIQDDREFQTLPLDEQEMFLERARSQFFRDFNQTCKHQ